MKTLRHIGLALAAVTLAATSLTCSGEISEPERRPTALVELSGDGQLGPVAQPLPEPLMVRVDDGQGRPIEGVEVTWVAGGGGSVSQSTVLTGADGTAAVQRTLGETAGTQTTTASVAPLTPVVFTSTAEAGEQPQLVLTAQPPATAQSGVPLGQGPVVRAIGGTGEPMGAGVPVTVAVNGATLGGTTTVETNEHGNARFADLVLTGPDGTYVLAFSAPGLVGIQSIAITLGSVTGTGRLVVVTQPSSAAQNAVVLAQQPEIRVEDGAGQPSGAGIPVTASVTGASLGGTTTVQTDASGIARFTDLALSGSSGSYPLSFASPNLPTIQSGPVTLTTTTSEGGQWTDPFPWPIVGVHMVLMPNGQVLTIGRVGTPQVWDPQTGAFTPVPSPAWLFCAGHALLADGTVLLAGGHISDGHGLPNITLFSGGNTWSTAGLMARGRWYPTTTVMGNGDVLITAGRDEDSLEVPIPEVWSNGAIRQLTGASQALPYYPRAFLAADGSVYFAGPTIQTRFLTVSGNGAWRNGPRHLFQEGRDYGSAVMYDDGKILYAGGARTTNTAEVIDLNQATPAWNWTSPMAFARRHLNLTVLPTGEVLATGGVAGTAFNDVSTGVHAAEMWNPTTGQWTTLASSAVTRGYHATSLLLPDGRVLHGGSGDGAGAPNERNAELYSPPYLFRGARPVITDAPADIGYGEQFRILTPQASAITKVSFIRLGAVTHAFDENQRFQRLAFTADAAGLTVTAPSSSNRAPPGHYLVFVLNGADVPSVARIVRIH